MTDLPTGINHSEDLAGEYVLGTLSREERVAAEARMRKDSQFAKEISDWEVRLSPGALALSPETPPTQIFNRIMAAIGDGNVVKLRRQISVWRGTAAMTTALAAALALFIIVKPAPQQLGHYVAVLNTQGLEAPFVVSVDLASQTVSVRRAGAGPQAGKSYELWAVGGGREKPQSLGVIDAKLDIPAGKLGGFDLATVFAVSLEPEGGSPTGQPTGPVLYTGKLYSVE